VKKKIAAYAAIVLLVFLLCACGTTATPTHLPMPTPEISTGALDGLYERLTQPPRLDVPQEERWVDLSSRGFLKPHDFAEGIRLVGISEDAKRILVTKQSSIGWDTLFLLELHNGNAYQIAKQYDNIHTSPNTRAAVLGAPFTFVYQCAAPDDYSLKLVSENPDWEGISIEASAYSGYFLPGGVGTSDGFFSFETKTFAPTDIVDWTKRIKEANEDLNKENIEVSPDFSFVYLPDGSAFCMLGGGVANPYLHIDRQGKLLNRFDDTPPDPVTGEWYIPPIAIGIGNVAVSPGGDYILYEQGQTPQDPCLLDLNEGKAYPLGDLVTTFYQWRDDNSFYLNLGNRITMLTVDEVKAGLNID